MATRPSSKNAVINKSFGKRLTQLMVEHGYIAPRSPLKADAKALKELLDCSHQMARLYILGESMPSWPRIKKLGAWLGVEPEWLAMGQGEKSIDKVMLKDCLQMTVDTAKDLGIELTIDQISTVAAYVYDESVKDKMWDRKKVLDIVRILV